MEANNSSAPEGKVKPPIWKNVGPRVVSALLLAAICVPPLYLGGYVWAIFVLILGLRLVYEWVRMSDKNGKVMAMAIPMTGLIAAITYIIQGYDLFAFIALIVASLAAGLERMRRGGALWSAFGALYVSIPTVLMVVIRGTEAGFSSGLRVMLFIIIVVVAADVGAYFGGSAMKGPKMAPKLSPNKTWSGFMSGMVLGCAFGFLVGHFLGLPVALTLMLSIAIGVFSVIGDFVESGFKRRFKVKDTGNIIPGHGGLLDRVDGLMLAVFVSALFMWAAPSFWTLF